MYSIYVPTDEEVQSGFLSDQMRRFNYQHIGQYGYAEPIRTNMRSEAGAVIAGLRSFVFLNWLRVEILWVAENYRERGLGEALLKDAEARATVIGAVGCVLETFGWQAERFTKSKAISGSDTLMTTFKGIH